MLHIDQRKHFCWKQLKLIYIFRKKQGKPTNYRLKFPSYPHLVCDHPLGCTWDIPHYSFAINNSCTSRSSNYIPKLDLTKLFCSSIPIPTYCWLNGLLWRPWSIEFDEFPLYIYIHVYIIYTWKVTYQNSCFSIAKLDYKRIILQTTQLSSVPNPLSFAYILPG